MCFGCCSNSFPDVYLKLQRLMKLPIERKCPCTTSLMITNLVARKLNKYRVIQKEVYTFKNLFYKYYWTYGDVLYIDWREKSQSYFHTLQALYVSPTCDVADVKSIIQLFLHSSQHVTVNSSHSLSDVTLRIIDIRALRDFLSFRKTWI
jgi:hypothetical protein